MFAIPASRRRWPNVGFNSKPTLGRRFMFAVMASLGYPGNLYGSEPVKRQTILSPERTYLTLVDLGNPLSVGVLSSFHFYVHPGAQEVGNMKIQIWRREGSEPGTGKPTYRLRWEKELVLGPTTRRKYVYMIPGDEKVALTSRDYMGITSTKTGSPVSMETASNLRAQVLWMRIDLDRYGFPRLGEKYVFDMDYMRAVFSFGVRIIQNTSICTGGQVWNYCGKPEECTPTCTQRMPKCTESCTLRCECPPQMVLHESQCVPITECPELPACLEELANTNMDDFWAFVPTCDSSGAYHTVQCHRPLEQCWCVDIDGREIINTRTDAKTLPDCKRVTPDTFWGGEIKRRSTYAGSPERRSYIDTSSPLTHGKISTLQFYLHEIPAQPSTLTFQIWSIVNPDDPTRYRLKWQRDVTLKEQKKYVYQLESNSSAMVTELDKLGFMYSGGGSPISMDYNESSSLLYRPFIPHTEHPPEPGLIYHFTEAALPFTLSIGITIKEEAVPPCPNGQEWTLCGVPLHCTPACGTSTSVHCPVECTPRCQCPTDKVLLLEQCVLYEDCLASFGALYGNEAIRREDYLNVPGHQTMIDAVSILPPGRLRAFQFYIHEDARDLDGIKLQIWRGGNLTYRLVWEREVKLGEGGDRTYLYVCEEGTYHVDVTDRIGFTSTTEGVPVSMDYTEQTTSLYMQFDPDLDGYPALGRNYQFNVNKVGASFSVGVRIEREMSCKLYSQQPEGATQSSGTLDTLSASGGHELISFLSH